MFRKRVCFSNIASSKVHATYTKRLQYCVLLQSSPSQSCRSLIKRYLSCGGRADSVMPGGEPTALCRGAGRQRYAPTALCLPSVMPCRDWGCLPKITTCPRNRSLGEFYNFLISLFFTKTSIGNFTIPLLLIKIQEKIENGGTP